MSIDQLARRILTHETYIENYKIRSNRLEQRQIDQIVTYTNQDNPVLWLDDDTSLRADKLIGKLKIHKQKNGLDLLIVDYIQLMKGTKQNRQEEVAEISRTLKLIAKELDICIIALSQLSRAVEQRTDHRPLLSDLRESGAIEQDADAILFPYRPAYYDEDKPEVEQAELIISKNRHGECVTIDVRFMGAVTKFSEE
jgi:replicative DNA helicase